MRTHQRVRVAFTLIELLVVIAIISLLASALVVGGMRYVASSRQKSTDARLSNLAHALTDYYNDFGAFPPMASAPGLASNDIEWWRYLTCTGSDFQRPQRFDGSIRDTAYIEEKDLGLPASGSPRLPRDAWKNPILYVYPVDNEIANLTSSDPTLPTGMRQMAAADAYYHCCVISQGRPPSAMPAVTPGRETNATAEASPTYVLKVASGK